MLAAMNRDLTEAEMEEVLRTQLYGHLGCTLPDRRAYVVPIMYTYRNGAIYAFSFPGLKIETLRSDGSACFQTEKFLSEGVWHSVIVWGTYEEIPDAERIDVIALLCDRLQREHGTATSPFYQVPESELSPGALHALREQSPILYRIRIEKKTGKHVHY